MKQVIFNLGTLDIVHWWRISRDASPQMAFREWCRHARVVEASHGYYMED